MTTAGPASDSAGPYTRVRGIAEGGMGFVELVVKRDGRFERLYARKRLHPHYRRDDRFRTMFMDEARLAGLVRHPNVVSVLDIGEDDEGPFLIMDYVEGVSVGALSAAAAGDHRVPVQIAVRIALEAARGLHAIHEARGSDGALLGIVHRDVSPQNLLVGLDGTVRVTDFGIAKAMGNASRTNAGVLKGNVGYLAPEQIRLEDLDRRADLFSLGVVLYELLAGRRLYASRPGTDDGPRRILDEAPPDVGEVRRDATPALTELLVDLLAKPRELRPATAEEVSRRCEQILAELIADEGPMTLAGYMRERFEGPLRAARVEIDRQVEATRRAMPASALQGRSDFARARRRGRARWVALALAAAFAAGAAGVLVARARLRGAAETGRVRAVWTGGWQTCALATEGLYCWGKNNEGQLGVGTTDDRMRATPVLLPRHAGGVTSVAAGGFHTCFCAIGAGALCTGSNDRGQLGTGDRVASNIPRPVAGVGACLAVAAGNQHACALRRDHAVVCWGDNRAGQLGRGGPDASDRPVPVPDLGDVVELHAAGAFTCARREDGAVLCWGQGDRGQLGDGSDGTGPPGPRRVALAEAAREISLGQNTACARTASGSVFCWGSDGDRKTHHGERRRLRPEPLSDLSGALQVATGASHVCAVMPDHSVRCVGSNFLGQLGTGPDRAYHNAAVVVAGLGDVLELRAGEVHTCARLIEDLRCWGVNETGQVGDSTKADRVVPVSVVGLR